MKVKLWLDRITIDPEVMNGQACIRDTRITVSLILRLLAQGKSTKDILEYYPELEEEDIKQALDYAAYLASEQSLLISK
ncbi:MAG: DUF433 domain-containing protein [Candidatus Nitrosocaldus sp.]